MIDRETIDEQIRAFQERYDYDASFLARLYEGSSAAHEAFVAAQSLGAVHGALPEDAYFVACIATMVAEDCGPCGQLNVRLALEGGVDRALIATLLESPDELPDSMRDIADHATIVARGGEVDLERVARIRKAYGEAGLAEIAAAIVGSRMYPAMKRALGVPGHCERPTVDFAPTIRA